MSTPSARPSSESGRDNSLQALVSSIHTFGEFGPAYQVLSIDSRDSATIIVLESEETLSYPIAKILDDPEA